MGQFRMVEGEMEVQSEPGFLVALQTVRKVAFKGSWQLFAGALEYHLLITREAGHNKPIYLDTPGIAGMATYSQNPVPVPANPTDPVDVQVLMDVAGWVDQLANGEVKKIAFAAYDDPADMGGFPVEVTGDVTP